MEMQLGRSLDAAVCCRTLNMHTNLLPCTLHSPEIVHYYCMSWCE